MYIYICIHLILSMHIGGLPTPIHGRTPPDDAAQILPGVGVLRKFPREAARPGHGRV